jgi:hypothetical protein
MDSVNEASLDLNTTGHTGYHELAAVLGMIGQLTGEKRAEVVAITAHAAKGREWGRILIAGYFAEPSAAGTVPRSEAMLAYIAVTRARVRRDQSGLAWIDTRAPVTTRKGPVMNARVPSPDDQPTVVKEMMSRPCAGGRAQAEFGCRIIATERPDPDLAVRSPSREARSSDGEQDGVSSRHQGRVDRER